MIDETALGKLIAERDDLKDRLARSQRFAVGLQNALLVVILGALFGCSAIWFTKSYEVILLQEELTERQIEVADKNKVLIESVRRIKGIADGIREDRKKSAEIHSRSVEEVVMWVRTVRDIVVRYYASCLAIMRELERITPRQWAQPTVVVRLNFALSKHERERFISEIKRGLEPQATIIRIP